ncbi:MAG: branched-chain amino acid ABC transporter permease [Bacteroidetes bacterium]|nr:branched-chain amino acid ABC transporter permease [Bacteroidota bacterium]
MTFLQILINIIYTSCIVILLSYSFAISYYPVKFFNITFAAIISTGAYLTYLLFRQLNIILWIAIPIATFLSAFIGVLFNIFIYRPLNKKKASSLLMLLVSLGIYIILQNCISLLWGDEIRSLQIANVKIGHEIFGAFITNVQIITISVSLTLFMLTIYFLEYNKIGKCIRAVSTNKELASIQGINSERVILWTIGIGSCLAAVAGILVATENGLTPTMGFNLLLSGVIAMIIGGVGSNCGLIGGSILLASAQQLTAYYMDSKWVDAVAYLILIMFLIWRPLGISGKRLKKIEI